MATLTWGDVVLIGLVATFGFALLSYWVSAWMTRHDVMGQVKGRPKTRDKEGAKDGAKAGAGSSKAATRGSAPPAPGSPDRKTRKA